MTILNVRGQRRIRRIPPTQRVDLLAVLGLALIAPATLAHAAGTVTSVEASLAGADYTVRWQTSSADTPVTVRVSANAAAQPARMTILKSARGSGSFTVAEPAGPGRRPYFYVSVEGGVGLRSATRRIPLDGASNFRDLGGYAGADGKHVVWGRLFRSNALADLTTSDYQAIQALRIRLVCDLRADSERQKQPTHWPGIGPEFVTSPKANTDSIMKVLFAGASNATAARAAMLDFYRQMPTLYAPENRTLFAQLLASKTPLILHCTAGKDRSGLASALILSALGVSRGTIERDYSLSAAFRAQAAQTHKPSDGLKANLSAYSKLPPDVMAVFEGSEPAYIDAALDEIAAHWGSVDNYLEKELGVGPKERAQLRALYLE